MSESFICRRGGVGTPFAVIGVTYPEGSTCTCSDGTKTLTAKGTSGRAIFNIPYAGTWTVTATNGESTASESVSITEDGQSESVKLEYELVLWDNGSVNEDITGGWSNQDGTVINLWGGYSDTSATTKNTIDLTPYSSIEIQVNSSEYAKNTYSLFGASSINNPGAKDFAASSKLSTAVSSTTTYTADISTLSGSFYVAVFTHGYTENISYDPYVIVYNSNIQVSKIVLKRN